MPNIAAIVEHTPLWVFALLALLVFFGVQALRPRKPRMLRLLIVPAVFITWGVTSLLARSAISPILLLDWLAAAVLGFAIGWLTTHLDGVRIDRAARCVELPGSVVPLVRNLSIFAAKYCLTAASAIAPARQAMLAPWNIGVSGLSAGYFIAWLVRLALKYRAAAAPEATAPTL